MPKQVKFGEERVRYLPPNGEQRLRDYQINSEVFAVKSTSPRENLSQAEYTSRFRKKSLLEILSEPIEVVEVIEVEVTSSQIRRYTRCHECLKGLAKNPFYLPCVECL